MFLDPKADHFLATYNLLMSRQWINKDNVVDSQPIAQMLNAFFRRVAREENSVARLANYFQEANVAPSAGGGRARPWNLKTLSIEVLTELVHRQTDAVQVEGRPDEWDSLIG